MADRRSTMMDPPVEGLLDKVVRPVRIAAQCERKGAKPRNGRQHAGAGCRVERHDGPSVFVRQMVVPEASAAGMS